MKITDIIALAKQGYKPTDIERLIALDEPKPETPQGDKSGEGEESNIDYKSLYEAEKAKVEELQKDARNEPSKEPDAKTDEQKAIDALAKVLGA